MLKKLRCHFRLVIAVAALVLIAVGSALAQNSDAKVLSSPEFTLSAEAETAGIDGTVTVYVTVTKDGSVKAADIIAGPAWPCGTSPEKELKDVRNAIKANVLASKFQPAIKDGKPKQVDIGLSFVIGESYRAAQRKKAMADAVARGEPVPKWVKGGVLNGKALSLPKPDYPSAAKANLLRGTVSIEVLIDESGKVVQAGAIDGHPLLQMSSRISACGAKYPPTLLGGQPVKVSGILTYTFVP